MSRLLPQAGGFRGLCVRFPLDTRNSKCLHRTARETTNGHAPGALLTGYDV